MKKSFDYIKEISFRLETEIVPKDDPTNHLQIFESKTLEFSQPNGMEGSGLTILDHKLPNLTNDELFYVKRHGKFLKDDLNTQEKSWLAVLSFFEGVLQPKHAPKNVPEFLRANTYLFFDRGLKESLKDFSLRMENNEWGKFIHGNFEYLKNTDYLKSKCRVFYGQEIMEIENVRDYSKLSLINLEVNHISEKYNIDELLNNLLKVSKNNQVLLCLNFDTLKSKISEKSLLDNVKIQEIHDFLPEDQFYGTHVRFQRIFTSPQDALSKINNNYKLLGDFK